MQEKAVIAENAVAAAIMLLISFFFIFVLLIITNLGSSEDYAEYPHYLYMMKMSGGIIILRKFSEIFYFWYSHLTTRHSS